MADKKWYSFVTESGMKFAYWSDGSANVENLSIAFITPQGWMWNKIADDASFLEDGGLFFIEPDKQTIGVLNKMWDDAPVNNGKGNLVFPSEAERMKFRK